MKGKSDHGGCVSTQPVERSRIGSADGFLGEDRHVRAIP